MSASLGRDLRTLVGDYVDARMRRGEIAPITGRDLRYNLRRFVHLIGSPPACTLGRSHINAWLEMVDMSPSTLRTRLSQISMFGQWLVLEGVLTTDPTFGVRRPREPRRLPRGMRPDQIAALLAVAPDARARMIVLLMVQEGLRCKEVAGLDMGDVDLEQQLVMVRGKGGHERVVPLTEETLEALRSYLSEAPTSAGPLVRARAVRLDGLPSRWDTRSGLTPGYVSHLMTEWMYQAGLKDRPYDGRSGHALRHTAATDMLRGGAHVRDVQALLGHSSLATTQRYLSWVVGDLRKAMSGRRYGQRLRPVQRSAADA